MQVSRILAEIDSEIERLQQARNLLVGIDGSSNRRHTSSKPAKKAARKHRISAEGRRRISEALKRSWAARKKQASSPKAK